MAPAKKYPVQLTVDYPDHPLDRVSTLFRIFTLVPIGIVCALLLGGGDKTAAAGFVVLPTVLMILFCRKYPQWWYEWNVNLTRFVFRVAAYAALLGDEYPSTDEEQYVHVRLPYPNVKKQLSRWLPLVKWLLAVPHYIVLLFLSMAALAAVIVAWFAILFTGNMPPALFHFIVGVMRWHLRVLGYAALMLTDQYPPFTLGAK
ncbi:DUF4389 domain-containing protein [candidate division FCPU426 bacterium]|nr:DUF4389 domain-containing protein [candidate division FCPU426 bacterium]